MEKKTLYVFGIRGFPEVIGGAEKHCQSLYSHIAALGYDVCILQRSPYAVQNPNNNYDPIRFVNLWTVRNKYLEVIAHSLLASFKCIIDRPNIIHVHNIGPCIVLPLLKLFNRNIVVTYHRKNYLDSKWGTFAKFILKLGEFWAKKHAAAIIYVSRQFKGFLPAEKSYYLPNGIDAVVPHPGRVFLDQIDVSPGKFILFSGRIEPEKAVDLLIKAFSSIKTDFKLVLAGCATHHINYERRIKSLAAMDKRIVLTGYIGMDRLNQLYAHARLFVLPSFHEGFSISLLEALNFGCQVLVSDIGDYQDLDLTSENLFTCGNVKDLKQKIERNLTTKKTSKPNSTWRFREKWNWQEIAKHTVNIYEKLLLP